MENLAPKEKPQHSELDTKSFYSGIDGLNEQHSRLGTAQKEAMDDLEVLKPGKVPTASEHT
jgi:hypothetical protein